MSRSIGNCAILLFLVVHVDAVWKNVHQSANVRLEREPQHSEDESTIWMEYEFDTGAGNREKLAVTDISVREYEDLPGTATNWQYLEVNGSNCFFRAEGSTLSFYKVDLHRFTIEDFANFTVEGSVLTFQAAKLEDIALVVACVQSELGTWLRWYRLVNASSFELFWSWPVGRYIKDIKFVEGEGSRKLLLLLNNDEVRSGVEYSLIDVYGLHIDFAADTFHFWLCQRIVVAKTLDMQVCSIHESVALALQTVDEVLLYEYRNSTRENTFGRLQTIKSNDLKNFVCFESGYLQFLAISGPEAALFRFLDGEFQFNVESEADFDVSEIRWVKHVRLDTYRDESLLLIQLKNNTVIGLSWQGLSFQRIRLPNNVLDGFDLSRIASLPRYGFIFGNRLVKLHTELKKTEHPIQRNTERLLGLKRLLTDSLNRQERILEETKSKLEKSHLKKPVISGIWNISTANAREAVISDNVIYRSIQIDAVRLTNDELDFDADDFAIRLSHLSERLDDVDSNLMNALDLDSAGLRFHSDVRVFGNIHVIGGLNVEHMNASLINSVNATNLFPSNFMDQTLDLTEAKNLTIRRLNGVPAENVRFARFATDYPRGNTELGEISKARLDGHLSFLKIDGIDWESLMKRVVWKDRPMFIPGNAIVRGTLVADALELFYLNDLLYPESYVSGGKDASQIVTGWKSFDSLLASHLENVTKLNGVDFEDYVLLYKDNVLTEGIAFENLTVVAELRVDGEAEGFNFTEDRLLNETFHTLADTTFLNLNVLGNVTFDSLLVNKRLLSLADLLLKTEKGIEISGRKTFLGNVGVNGSIAITSGMINGHYLDEFATFDTDQVFANLTKVSSNLVFESATLEAVKELEAFFQRNKNSSDCLERIVVFKQPIIVDQLSFGKLNRDISNERFTRKLHETFRNISVENLTSEIVSAEQITPNSVNGLDFANFTKTLPSSAMIGEYMIDRLETDRLNVAFINGLSLNRIDELKETVNGVLDDVINGRATLQSLEVRGAIQANLIDGNDLASLFQGNRLDMGIFKRGLSVERFTILGTMNGLNISERIFDTILDTDTDITIDGYKRFDTMNCYRLDATSLNEHPVENILDPSTEQTLSGPVVLNGSLTVLKGFDATGQIGDVRYYDLAGSFKRLENGTYELQGDARLLGDASIDRFYANGLIEGRNLNSLLETVVFKGEDNLTISGAKVFENLVTFKRLFVVRDSLNGIDLKRFQEKAIFVDQPFAVQSNIIFHDRINVEKDVAVESSLETRSIMEVDVNELQRNVLYLDKPAFVQGTIVFDRLVDLRSDVKVEKLNDVDTKLFIPLHTEQTVDAEVVKGVNLTADNVHIFQRVNGENLKRMKENTFTVTGNQNATGHFDFRGRVYVRRDFNARLVNGINPAGFVSLKSKSTVIGNFKFEGATLFDRSVRVLGYLNHIDPTRWEGVAVFGNDSSQQVVSGKWSVFGNVYLDKGASGSDTLNGTNVTEVSNVLASKRSEMNAVLTEKTANLDSMCEDLSDLKRYAEKQIYRFDAFDYLQMVEFDSNVSSIHHFEMDRLDYLALSYNNCQMRAYLFTGRKFQLVGSVADFGAIERWITFKDDRTLYFLTSGVRSCGRSPVNVWKLEDDEFQHVLSLGHSLDTEKIDRNMFFTLLDGNTKIRSSGKMDEKLDGLDSEPASTSNRYKYKVNRSNDTSFGRYSGDAENVYFKAGLRDRRMILYYEDKLSKDRIFICDNDAETRKIVQVVKAHRPSSFAILNFEGSTETLLVFIENRKNLRIYEYKGIQGFVYRDSIRVNADKLFTFKFRKHTGLARRHCLALIRGNKVTILQAKMYGEKVDVGRLACSKD